MIVNKEKMKTHGHVMRVPNMLTPENHVRVVFARFGQIVWTELYSLL